MFYTLTMLLFNVAHVSMQGKSTGFSPLLPQLSVLKKHKIDRQQNEAVHPKALKGSSCLFQKKLQKSAKHFAKFARSALWLDDKKI